MLGTRFSDYDWLCSAAVRRASQPQRPCVRQACLGHKAAHSSLWFVNIALTVQVLNLESKCADLQVNITALREEISERESVIAQNYTTIQLLRRRLADMEKHRFVLGYRTQVR